MLGVPRRRRDGDRAGTAVAQGLWSVGSHFSMTFTPSPFLVVSKASRAFSRGKRWVTKGLTLIRLDASRAMATGHLPGERRRRSEKLLVWHPKERARRSLALLQ